MMSRLATQRFSHHAVATTTSSTMLLRRHDVVVPPRAMITQQAFVVAASHRTPLLATSNTPQKLYQNLRLCPSLQTRVSSSSSSSYKTTVTRHFTSNKIASRIACVFGGSIGILGSMAILTVGFGAASIVMTTGDDGKRAMAMCSKLSQVHTSETDIDAPGTGNTCEFLKKMGSMATDVDAVTWMDIFSIFGQVVASGLRPKLRTNSKGLEDLKEISMEDVKILLKKGDIYKVLYRRAENKVARVYLLKDSKGLSAQDTSENTGDYLSYRVKIDNEAIGISFDEFILQTAVESGYEILATFESGVLLLSPKDGEGREIFAKLMLLTPTSTNPDCGVISER